MQENSELTYADHARAKARSIDRQARDLCHVEFDDWIPHDGGGIDLYIHQIVNLRYRDGTVKNGKQVGDRCWVHYGRGDDIMEYQIVTENE